jgi:hypothetical protein
MGCGRTAERGGEIGRRRERGAVAVDAAGQSRGNFLQQPAIAVGIAERGIRTVAAACRIRREVNPSDLIGCDIYGCETSHVRVGKDAPNETE